MNHTVGVFASLFDRQGRIILVQQSYAGQCWTQPGGRLEAQESPIEGLLREIYEETAIRARVDAYVGTYVTPHLNDILLHFRASVLAKDRWASSGEISNCGAFDPQALPSPMRVRTVARVADAVAGRTNVFRTLLSADKAIDL